MRGSRASLSSDTPVDSLNEGSSCFMRVKGKKTDKGRRVWTSKEEEVIMLSMKHVVAAGWKSDNGFRAGYLKLVEDHFKKHLPTTDLTANPHMNSKLGAWKKNYYSLCTILNHSGVGFNTDGNWTVKCEAAVWDELEKVDRNARIIRDRSWPLYEGWKEIFGKDRATGELAEDVIDAVNELEHEFATFDDSYAQGDYHVSLDDFDIPDTTEQSPCQTQGSTQLPKLNGKKRKSNHDAIETVCTLLNEISRSTNDKLEALATRVGYDQEMGKARMEIYSSLDNLPGLSIDNKLKFCEFLVRAWKSWRSSWGSPNVPRLHTCHSYSTLCRFMLIFYPMEKPECLRC